TFTLSKNAEVGIAVGSSRRGSFREGQLADLAPGALVVLQLTADQKAVEGILAEGPTVRGTIKTVDAGKRTITVTVTARQARREEAAAPEEKTFPVSPQAEIGVD